MIVRPTSLGIGTDVAAMLAEVGRRRRQQRHAARLDQSVLDEDRQVGDPLAARFLPQVILGRVARRVRHRGRQQQIGCYSVNWSTISSDRLACPLATRAVVVGDLLALPFGPSVARGVGSSTPGFVGWHGSM